MASRSAASSAADDYVVKPFSMAELQARIDAVMRRSARSATRQPRVTVGALTVDLDAHRVEVDGREISLTRKEFDLLAALLRRPGGTVTREQLLAEVWHTTWLGSPHTVEVHVASLRAKLGDPGMVQTVRGVGYDPHAAPVEDVEQAWRGGVDPAQGDGDQLGAALADGVFEDGVVGGSAGAEDQPRAKLLAGDDESVVLVSLPARR